jgi:hypothetical protein
MNSARCSLVVPSLQFYNKDQYCAGTGSDFTGYSGKGFSFGGKDPLGQGSF